MPIKSERHDGVMCVLVDQQSGTPVETGDTYLSRGFEYNITSGSAPHSPASTGRVHVLSQAGVGSFFLTVFDLKWVPESEV